MHDGIKNTIDQELRALCRDLDQDWRLQRLSPLLSRRIKEFILRPGKRLRPMLFVLGYKAYCPRRPHGLLRSALAMELLHDFMLVHDDIIDRSSLRRGKPSMHTMFAGDLAALRNAKCSGTDLAIIAGDVLYALALEAFLAVREQPQRKERALQRFVRAAFTTGCGEFIELELAAKPLKDIQIDDIYRVYDLKTAYYTFAYPLSIGACLAGADERQIKRLFDYGVCLGRAFQIKDDILGMFGDEAETGKSALTDLQEAKRTLLLWHAAVHASTAGRRSIARILAKKTITLRDLTLMRRLLIDAGSLDFARRRVELLRKKADSLLAGLAVQPAAAQTLQRLSRTVLKD